MKESVYLCNRKSENKALSMLISLKNEEPMRVP